MPIRPTRAALISVLAIALLGAVPAAQAFDGDWTIAGEFARTTTPSFAGGFNPNDIDRVSVTYDNRAKQLSLDLSYFEVPGRDYVQASLGTGQPDGSCLPNEITINISSRDLMTTRDVTEPVRYWVPQQDRYTWYNTWQGYDWTYAGYDPWRRSYHWIKSGYWAYRNVTHTVTEPDPNHYERVADLGRSGIDGVLQSVANLELRSTSMHWTFASPLLDGTTADCLEIRVPGRANPFVLAPPTSPPPTDPADPSPSLDPGSATDPGTDEIDLTDVTATATRRGTKIDLHMTGDAALIGIRVRKSSKTITFRPAITLRNQPTTIRNVSVRFSDGTDWSDWERIPVDEARPSTNEPSSARQSSSIQNRHNR